jgi:transcriptional regulator with XRE-family HTH domain
MYVRDDGGPRGTVHYTYMAKKAHPTHYLRQWREHRELSLEAVAEKIMLLSAERAADGESRARTMTHATLSRIERGKLPYNQHLLELLAEIYQTTEASLLVRDPQDPDGLWSIYDQLKPVERQQLVEMAKVFKRTGTEG